MHEDAALIGAKNVLTVKTSERELTILTLLVLLLAVCGFAISVVALDQHVRYSHGLATGPSFCNVSDYLNCEAVNASTWSTIAGIPIASYGMFFYLVLIGGAIAALLTRSFARTAFMHFVLLASTVSVVGSIGLFILSSVVIQALCLLCISLYAINFALFLVAWRRVFPGRLREGLVASGAMLGNFGRTVVRGERSGERWAARVVVLGVALLAYWNAKAPDVLLSYFLSKAQPRAASAGPSEAVSGWRAAPAVQFALKVDEGPFGDYARGVVGAPIQIVEFADYECGACRMMSYELHELLERYEGKYHFVFRNYPLDNSCNPSITRAFHRYACLAAHLSRCAGEQGKFWEVNKLLFTAEQLEGEQSVDVVQNQLIEQSGSQFGLDRDGLRECVQSRRYAAALQRDMEEAERVGLQGTPTIWVNGRQVSEPSPEALEAIFQHVLADAEKP